MVNVINSVICEFWVWLAVSTVRSQVSDYSQLSNYNCTEWLVKNKAANAPITFGEIVMVMISIVSSVFIVSAVDRFVAICFHTMDWWKIKQKVYFHASASQFLRNHTTEIELPQHLIHKDLIEVMVVNAE